MKNFDKLVTLGEFIIKDQAAFPYATGELSALLSSLRLAAKVVNAQINKSGLVDDIIGQVGKQNIQGEAQQKLDVYANQVFINALEARNLVCGIASEEEDSYVTFNSDVNDYGKYVILIDPLDGSSNIDVNVSIGTIFSIYRRVSPAGTKAEMKDFLQKGSEQVAAGYIVYGSSTMLVYTVGDGVNGFTFDPTIGVFYLSHPDIKIPSDGGIYSVNEGNYPYFDEGIKDYLKHCKEEKESDGRPYSARYIGSMVSDIHRNMLKGGIYLYPATKKNPNGKLRLLYECNPMSLIIENAGGRAHNGSQRILDIEPTELHQRCPFFNGSSKMMQELDRFIGYNKT
jgi:fructose-1,6-bisphosphatase I